MGDVWKHVKPHVCMHASMHAYMHVYMHTCCMQHRKPIHAYNPCIYRTYKHAYVQGWIPKGPFPNKVPMQTVCIKCVELLPSLCALWHDML